MPCFTNDRRLRSPRRREAEKKERRDPSDLKDGSVSFAFLLHTGDSAGDSCCHSAFQTRQVHPRWMPIMLSVVPCLPVTVTAGVPRVLHRRYMRPLLESIRRSKSIPRNDDAAVSRPSAVRCKCTRVRRVLLRVSPTLISYHLPAVFARRRILGISLNTGFSAREI